MYITLKISNFNNKDNVSELKKLLDIKIISIVIGEQDVSVIIEISGNDMVSIFSKIKDSFSTHPIYRIDKITYHTRDFNPYVVFL